MFPYRTDGITAPFTGFEGIEAANSILYWFVTFAGVLVFCGLTAYDMQKIKKIGESGLEGDTMRKASILGALSLYLDFINLFLFMLRIFGSARS